MIKSDRQMQELSVFVHGILVAFHVLGIVYNARRRNRVDVVAHAAAAAYDLYAVSNHIRNLKELE